MFMRIASIKGFLSSVYICKSMAAWDGIARNHYITDLGLRFVVILEGADSQCLISL